MPKSTGRTVIVTLALALVLVVALVLVIAWSGAYNVAATEPHTGPVAWLLHVTKERSIAARADEVPASPELTEDEIRHGWEHFGDMCAPCHGAPGQERGEIGKGLNPEPPDLEDAATEFSRAEIFWIVKHGIKLAGMPGFGSTHDDRSLWAMSRIVEMLPETTPEEYLRLSGAAPQAGDSAAAGESGDAGHPHPPGTPAHSH